MSSLKLVTGSVLALFLGLLFIGLFYSGDPIFQNYFQKMTSSIHIDLKLLETPLKLLLAFGLFSALLRPKTESLEEFSVLTTLKKYHIETALAVIVLIFIVGSFLVVQAQFLFAGNELLQQLGIMHSEYTRRGFAELIIVSAISLSLVAILIHARGKLGIFPIRGIALVFLGEVLLVLLSAVWRVHLYQDNFGLTQARVLGFLFALWLAGALVIFFYKLIGKLNGNLVSHLFLNAIVVILLMNVINIDRLVGVVKKPTLGYGTDYNYVTTRLSTDAWESWEEALLYLESSGSCDWTLAPNMLKLQQQLKDLKEREKNSWNRLGAWVLPDTQALVYLKDNEARIHNLTEKYLSLCRYIPR